MKKKFLFVSLAAMLGFGAFVVSSCSDDDDTCKICGEEVTDAELKAAGVSCADMKSLIKLAGGCEAIEAED
ncbi:MAG: hypothetical protein LBV31_00100 [Prevotellaceae bacterium]|jgi:hypothetical protein|nr:hypothetical protein [Prevotellaceae bacterium]